MNESITQDIVCPGCRQSKRPTAFSVDASRKSGRFRLCRDCDRQRRLDYLQRKQSGEVIPKPSVAERFWTKVQKTEHGCWLWTGATDLRGYGRFRGVGKSCLAHRFSYELHYGPIAVGALVLHHCDTPSCVRPDHLYAGTQADNVRDMWGRGRAKITSSFRNNPERARALRAMQKTKRGEEHPLARLSESDIHQIHDLYSKGLTQREIGKHFGIDQSTVSNIVTGRSWGHVLNRGGRR